MLKSDGGHGYIRVDWFAPDGLPTWGDGRLFIQGTDGQIELVLGKFDAIAGCRETCRVGLIRVDGIAQVFATLAAFEGTGIAVVAPMGPGRGRVRIRVDGGEHISGVLQ